MDRRNDHQILPEFCFLILMVLLAVTMLVLCGSGIVTAAPPAGL